MAWYPKATRVPADRAGTMDGTNGTRKVVIHTEGVTRGKDGANGNAVDLAKYVASRGIAYHFIIDRHGRIAQCYPTEVAARSLKAGRWSPNKQGKRAVQICFAGVTSMEEVKSWRLNGWWTQFVQWLEEDSGVPPTSVVPWGKASRSEKAWRKSGWTSHAHAPFNDHTDGLDTPLAKLLAGSILAKAPKPQKGKGCHLVVTRKNGKRAQVFMKTNGRFTWRSKKARGVLTKTQARKGWAWAKKRGAKDPKVVKRGRPKFVELRPGAKWPKDKALVARLDRVGCEAGTKVRIVSGYRSMAEQWQLYRLYKSGQGNLAAYPNERAPHIRGVAADCGTVDSRGRYLSLGHHAKAANVARRLGLAALVPGEPWHWQRRSTY